MSMYRVRVQIKHPLTIDSIPVTTVVDYWLNKSVFVDRASFVTHDPILTYEIVTSLNVTDQTNLQKLVGSAFQPLNNNGYECYIVSIVSDSIMPDLNRG